ncbi:MAG: serine/threonine protein phosphatase [Ruminococcaceae bacterium]|nr:serine/threonine protein phosphatase [Oscillospiraceae bacterium]
MSIFAISDLHLSFSADKPMDIFRGWENYEEKIKKNWCKIVKENDTVILPGDLSWGLKIDEAKADFAFLNDLPGKKILLKGNHDLWWGTAKKMREFLAENNFSKIDFVFNNCIVAENFAVCGTRGWFFDGGEDKKVLLREAGRLEMSIKEAIKTGLEPLVFLHYPPVFAGQVCEEIFSVLKKYDIKKIYYGHVHGAGKAGVVNEYDGIMLKLVSCDSIDFTPFCIKY